MTSRWRVILDARDTRCYPGSGTTLTNLGDAVLNFVRTGTTHIPTFSGSADSLDAYFAFDGGAGYLAPSSGAKVLFNNVHKAGGALSWCIPFYLPSTTGSNSQVLAASCRHNNTGPGWRLHIPTNFIPQLTIGDDTLQTVYSIQPPNALATNAWHIWCGAIKDGNAQGYTYDTTNGFTTDNVIYGQGALADPSTSDMQSNGVYIGTDGSDTTIFLRNLFRLKGMMLTDELITRDQMAPIIWTAVRQVQEGLYV